MARLSPRHLTETALSQNATGQEKARLGTLGYFRTDSAPFGKRSQGRKEAGRGVETTFPMMQWELKAKALRLVLLTLGQGTTVFQNRLGVCENFLTSLSKCGFLGSSLENL